MTNLSVPLVPTSVPKPSNLNDMKVSTPLIEWCDPVLKDLGVKKQFSGGSNTYWDRDDVIRVTQDRMKIFNPDNSGDNRHSCQLSTNAGAEHYYIAYVEFDIGRHFTQPFTWMGVEWYQTDDSNNSCHIRQIGREYKNPSTGLVYSYSTGFWGESNKETRGYFHYINEMSQTEIDYQKDGYLLNRILFNLRTTSGMGSSHWSSCEVFNLRFGWGDGEPSTNHMIALPKIRPLDEHDKPAYGDDE